MKPIGFARSQAFWHRFGWGTLMGLLGGLAAFVYAFVMHRGLHLMWHGDLGIAPFSGLIKIAIITTIAGIVIGIIHKTMPTEEAERVTRNLKAFHRETFSQRIARKIRFEWPGRN